jgi:prevent-host-death family protein
MVSASEFKAKCLSLLDEVYDSGRELVISKHGRAVAKLVPVVQEKPWKGLLGSGKFCGDPFAPAVEEKSLEVLR